MPAPESTEPGDVFSIRTYTPDDEAQVIGLWHDAGITRPWNDPKKDIARKLEVQPELFLVGLRDSQIVATVMASHDGHRGAVYYLAVLPTLQRRGLARRLMLEVERRLTLLGCPKLNLNVRVGNDAVLGFYRRLGYAQDPVVTMSKRLSQDEPT